MQDLRRPCSARGPRATRRPPREVCSSGAEAARLRPMPHDHDQPARQRARRDDRAGHGARDAADREGPGRSGARSTRIVELYERQIGPRNGARVVARAWTDPDFAAWLREDATAAIASLGFGGRQGEHMRAVFNTPEEHNLVVCTLCSCYPWSVLGLPPVWYKAPAYRSRAVIDPRGVLAEFGLTLDPGTRDPGLGLDRRAALPRRADAPRGQRGHGRGGARRARHPRLDDRHRPAAARHERPARPRRRRWASGRWRPSPTSRSSTPTGSGARSALTLAAGGDGRLADRREPARPREPAPGRLLRLELLRDLDQGRSSGCSSATASSPRPSSPAAAPTAAAPGRSGCSRAAEVPAAIARGGPCDRDPAGRRPGLRRRRRGAHPSSCTRPATPGCRATPAASAGASRRCRASSSSPTATPTAAARRRSGSTPWSSTARRALGPRRRPGEQRLDRRLGELP